MRQRRRRGGVQPRVAQRWVGDRHRRVAGQVQGVQRLLITLRQQQGPSRALQGTRPFAGVADPGGIRQQLLLGAAQNLGTLTGRSHPVAIQQIADLGACLAGEGREHQGRRQHLPTRIAADP